MSLTLRREKGTELTHDELDDNFVFLSTLSSGNNILGSGNFHINPWSMGESFPVIIDGTETANGWFYIKKNSTVFNTVERVVDGPALEDAGIVVPTSLGVITTIADSSQGSNNLVAMSTNISGYDFASIAGKQSVVSFFVKSSVVGKYGFAIRNYDKTACFVGEYEIEEPDTWEKKSIVIPAGPTTGTWNYGEGVGAELVWTIMGGTDYQTLPGSWGLGNKTTTPSQANGVDAIGNGWAINLVKWEVGNSPTPFENPPHALVGLLAGLSEDGDFVGNADSWYFWHSTGFLIQGGLAKAVAAVANRTVTYSIPFDVAFGGFANDAKAIALQSLHGQSWSIRADLTTARINNPMFGVTDFNWVVFGFKSRI